MEKFCDSPWNHMNINNLGRIKPCCVYSKPKEDPGEVDIFKWYKHAYKDLKAEGINHPGCVACKKMEDSNIVSRRQYTKKPGKGNQIVYLDISFGNTCNLKCMMCESRNSTKWIADEKYLIENGFEHLERGIVKQYNMPESRIKQIVNYCNNFEGEEFHLEVKGGEPFVTDQFLNFLTRLNDNFLKRCNLYVFSNGTGIEAKYFEQLKKFKRINCNLSIEAVGPLYKYIRGGADHSHEDAIEFMKEFSKNCPNSRIGVSVTITMYNLFKLKELKAEIDKFINYNLPEKVFSSFSYYPKYLSPGILPQTVKDELIAYYHEPYWQPVRNYLKNTESDPYMMRIFKQFTTLLDRKRNTSLYAYEPKFQEILDAV